MAFRASLVGAATGAVVGGAGRAAVAVAHFNEVDHVTAPFVVAAAAIGVVIGAIAGLTGRPLLGAVVGAGLSVLAFLGTLPFAMLFQVLGAGSAASLLEIVAVGALAGGVGGAAEPVLVGWRTGGRPHP